MKWKWGEETFQNASSAVSPNNGLRAEELANVGGDMENTDYGPGGFLDCRTKLTAEELTRTNPPVGLVPFEMSPSSAAEVFEGSV
jgi:hypothetical protein